MILNNLFNAFIGFLIALFILIGFGQTFENLLGIANVETRIFLGVIFTIIFVTIGFFMPIEMIIEGDKGDSN